LRLTLDSGRRKDGVRFKKRYFGCWSSVIAMTAV
jgi:hypothetical protein